MESSILRKVKRRVKRRIFGKKGNQRNRRAEQTAEKNYELAKIDAAAVAKAIEEQGGVTKDSFLFITLDSCRFDTFANAHAPNLKNIGEWYEAEAPASFTFPSHMSMFIGMTPGVAASREPYRNPKAGRIWRMSTAIGGGKKNDYINLSGQNIIDGFNNRGYYTLGAGAMNWFNRRVPTTKPLVGFFKDFLFTYIDVDAQMGYVLPKIKENRDQPMFVFVNVGETHVPYHYRGADWTATENPCVPFRDDNSRELSQERQRKCLEYVDLKLGPLIKLFQHSGASLVVCGDHGDCHGEDNLWAHGFYHEKVLKVPMVYNLAPRD